MADLGEHPRLARMALAAVDAGVAEAGCLVAAALGERDVLRGRHRGADLALRLRAIAAACADPQRREAGAGLPAGDCPSRDVACYWHRVPFYMGLCVLCGIRITALAARTDLNVLPKNIMAAISNFGVPSPGCVVVVIVKSAVHMSDLPHYPAGAVLDADAAQRVVRQFSRLLSSLRAARRLSVISGAADAPEMQSSGASFSDAPEREAQTQPAGNIQGCDGDAGDEAAAGRGSQSAAGDPLGAAPASVSVGSPGSSTGHAEDWSSADAWGAADEEEPCVGRAGGGDGPEDEEVAAEPEPELQRRSGQLSRALEQLFPGGRDEGLLGALVAAAYPDRVAQRRERGNRRAACRTCMSTSLHQLSCRATGRIRTSVASYCLHVVDWLHAILNNLLLHAGVPLLNIKVVPLTYL